MDYWIVALAVLARFAPHPPNFSPVYGALLFAGVYLKRRDAIWFPVLLLAVSDFLLTTVVYRMHFGWTTVFDWAGFAAVPLIGRRLRQDVSAATVAAGSLAGATAFFLLSNFGVWLGWQMYPPTWPGLAACYVAALPFFGYSLLGALFFSAILFGGYEYYRRRLDQPHSPAASAH